MTDSDTAEVFCRRTVGVSVDDASEYGLPGVSEGGRGMVTESRTGATLCMLERVEDVPEGWMGVGAGSLLWIVAVFVLLFMLLVTLRLLYVGSVGITGICEVVSMEDVELTVFAGGS